MSAKNSNKVLLKNDISISSEYDWVDEDEVISDQKFVVLSFCEPDVETLSKKESFIFSEFIKECLREEASVDKYRVNFSKVTPEKLLQLYNDYKIENDDHISNGLKKKYPNVVFERALKVRGAYKTQNKAQERVNYLKKYDRVHNIYVCEMGKWVPYNPAPAAIEDYETSNVHLNKMLAEKRKNQTEAKEFYERERQERIKQCAEVAEARNQKIRENDFDAIIAEHCEQEILGLVDEQFSKEPQKPAHFVTKNQIEAPEPVESIKIGSANTMQDTKSKDTLSLTDFENADFDEELAESIVKKLKINNN